MPEGPEIRRAADRVARAIRGKPVTKIWFAFEHLKAYEERLHNSIVNDVLTFGKAMVTCFDNQLCIYSHNQLYGRWMVRNSQEYPNTRRQLRLAIHTEGKSALLYSASDIEVLELERLGEHRFIRKLGPDPLDERVNAQILLEYFSRPDLARRRLASLFLDQSFLAGIGNYLRSEILFVAGAEPTSTLGSRDEAQRMALAQASMDIPRQSYRYNGITADRDLATELKAAGRPRRDYRHWVFGRAGKACYRCGTSIIKDDMAGRRIYWCPSCQT